MPVTIASVFTPNEQAMIEALLRVTPKSLLESVDDGHERDFKLLGIAQWALNDYNYQLPATSYTFDGLPRELRSLIAFGTQLFLMSMKQAEFSLIDINYNDNGLSISFDRVSKIAAAMDKVSGLWKLQIENNKKALAMAQGGAGLGVFRFQGTLSRYLNLVGEGSAVGWGIP